MTVLCPCASDADALLFTRCHARFRSDAGLALKIPQGATIVDVGAHFGLFSMECFAQSGLTSKHFCFEPVPKIREICNATMEGLDPDGDKFKVCRGTPAPLLLLAM